MLRSLIIILVAATWGTFCAAHAEPMPARYIPALKKIYAATQAPGMVATIVDRDQVYTIGFGRTSPTNPETPNEKTLLRINSLSKLMTAEVLSHLEREGALKLTNRLNVVVSEGKKFPTTHEASFITLRDLVVHTSGLPRDVPESIWQMPNPRQARWAWLEKLKFNNRPGIVAEYSNAAYLFLGDALEASARRPYDRLLSRYVFEPLALKDTTLSPSPAQCARLLSTSKPKCDPAMASAASWGVYSTSSDVTRWLQALMRAPTGSPLGRTLLPLVHRDQLKELRTLDFVGHTQAIAWGWIVMSAEGKRFVQKTGGGSNTMNYVIMSPENGKALFMTVARMDMNMLRRTAKSATRLMVELVGEAH